MKIGDLIKFDPDRDSLDSLDYRRLGTILRFDLYRGAWSSEIRGPASIIEVLWNTGVIGWILQSRVELIDES